MKKLFVVCAFASLLSSCGSVLMLNEAYTSPLASSTATTQTTAATTDGSNAALLGSLLGALAGNDASDVQGDGSILATDGIVSGLLGSILNAYVTVDESTIVGTWSFKGSAFVFDSENALASLGSDLVASQVESKVNQYLAKYNIKEGACSITFNEDETYAFVAGDRYVEGTYKLNPDTKELTMTFGLLATTANVVYDAGTINLVYQSDGLLNMIKAMGAKGNNATFALLNSMLGQYDGMRIGMAFSK